MIKSYFSKRDRHAIAALALLIVFGCGFLWVLGEYGKSHSDSQGRDSSYSQRRYYSKKKDKKYYYATEQNSVELFYFDPNTADSTALLKLGLRPWQVRNIYKYRSHGGIYRKPEDFAQLYGLSAHQYKQLLPYIRIAKEYSMSAAEYVGRDNHDRRSFSESHDTQDAKELIPMPKRKISPGEHIILNTADTTELMRVPGIGSYYSKVIMRYGKRLGGYVSIDQLDEIEDFPQEAKKYFIIDSPSPRRLNVNTMSLNELKRHPYINYYQAKAIIDYRRINGQIRSLQQLSTCPDFTDETIKRLLPYVTY